MCADSSAIGKKIKGCRGQELERGSLEVELCIFLVDNLGDEFIVLLGDGFVVDLDGVSGGNEVRGVVAADTETRGGEDRGEVGADGTLAVGACDVDNGKS